MALALHEYIQLLLRTQQKIILQCVCLLILNVALSAYACQKLALASFQSLSVNIQGAIQQTKYLVLKFAWVFIL
jgi:hypothetical protein